MKRTDSGSRLIEASPAAIYRAFLDADSLIRWLPPKGMSARVLELEPHQGGRYRVELRYEGDGIGKTGDRTDISQGRFVEMIPDERIVQSVEFESDDPAFAGEMRMTWTFEPVPRGTMVTVTAENVPSGISEEDHAAGLSSSLENLARLVERA